MPRRPKAKNTLSAGERAALYEAELAEKQRRMRELSDDKSVQGKNADRSIKADRVENVDLETVEQAKAPAKEKKVLPKPQVAVVRVDFSIPDGEIKPMHGMCNGPVSYGADITGSFREIGVPFVRFDATDSAVSAYAVDVSRIFKNFDADPSDAENYDFATTDKYVEAAVLCGSRIIYRIGESRDLLGGVSTVRRAEPDVLARVCVNIIRHYNDRWANGYSFGIDLFELWNVDLEGDGEEDFETYRGLANAVKLYDENIKVGGLSFAGFGDRARDFLRFCKRARVPLDFITVDCFEGDPHKAFAEAESFLLQMRRLGFVDTELIIGKWSYIDHKALGENKLSRVLSGSERYASVKRQMFEAQREVEGAAYAAAFMLEMARLDGVSRGCCYDAQPIVSPFCAITDDFGEPRKPLYVFKTFGELYRAKRAVFCEVDEPEGVAHSGIFARAAVSDTGECFVMLASFDGVGSVDLRLDGISENLYTADIYMLDGVKNMERCDSIPVSGMKKRLVLNVSGYGALMIKLY